MLFNSLVFAAFLPVVLALYYGLRHRGQNWMLLAASYLFYGCWDERFLFLMICSTAFSVVSASGSSCYRVSRFPEDLR